LKVTLDGIGKRFKRHWLYRNLHAELSPQAPLAIFGANGSGKSTLMQIISGYLTASAGTVAYDLNGNPVSREQIWKHVAIASPHLELHAAMTLEETLAFHHGLRPIPGFTSVKECAEAMQLSGHLHKPLASYSSGMRQRVKLYLAIQSNAPLLLLDEPTSNLDKTGVQWFRELLDAHLSSGRTVAVCSNLEGEETDFCTQRLQLADFS
jgi:ABC-type multidrug transport system ATPase subunit